MRPKRLLPSPQKSNGRAAAARQQFRCLHHPSQRRWHLHPATVYLHSPPFLFLASSAHTPLRPIRLTPTTGPAQPGPARPGPAWLGRHHPPVSDRFSAGIDGRNSTSSFTAAALQQLYGGGFTAALPRRLYSSFTAAALQQLYGGGFTAALQRRLYSGFTAAALQQLYSGGFTAALQRRRRRRPLLP